MPPHRSNWPTATWCCHAEHGAEGGDFLTIAVLTEALLRGMYTGPGFRVHSDRNVQT